MDEIPKRIWPLPAKKLNGIGPNAAEKLIRYGIHTIGDLAAEPVDSLMGKFGRRMGTWLHRVAHGIDERPVFTESEPKSISRESTFDRDLHAKQDREALSEIFTGLYQRVADDLQRKGYASRTIGIKLRYADVHAVTRDITLPVGICDGTAIRKAAGECLKRVSLMQRIRLLGVWAGGLVPLNWSDEDKGAVQAELSL